MRIISSQFTARLKAIAFPGILLMSSAITLPAIAAEWSLPWQGGTSATISRGTGSHKDGWNAQWNAVDFAIRAGTPVLAPVDSTILSVCQARGGDNHNSIWLRSADGDYTLMHVKATGLSRGQFFRRGDQIGVVAADTPNDPKCAISTGPHVHINFPNRNLVVDGYRVLTMTSGTYISKNRSIITSTPVDIKVVNFSAITAPGGVNVRSAASTSASIVGRLGGYVRVNFDAWKYGDSVADIWTGRPDRRWYRIAGTNSWIASAVVNGNAPGSQP
ncbi:M23 family metallopeptidase [Nostoc sp. FACHB-152]|uniref:peptidoglycan DD-metalloendopeptidase family protein n=1 Tax=unclassified Nostoc TaxID=2593658 RepID=UPI001686FA22|nr:MULTISPECIES: peptidoglycan DD-metalloendopeptidase family protein [unclassified Nostoc]MBD2448053.1 M23 family metallopeptidase [Nostoc sp. FACHB-152]MBD2466160.1 M23 family metallopeptidase [Nostoc sp. FACHB-145]